MHAGPPRYLDGLPRPPRALVMGVLNVTPDSFSDGGRYLDPSRALAHGRELVAAGADLVDVGGESTRPGAVRPTPEQEAERVLPVVEGLVARDVLVSVDTMRASVAEQAVAAGAVLVNDVSGGVRTPPCCPRWPGSARRTCSCTGARTPARWSSTPRTATWSAT